MGQSDLVAPGLDMVEQRKVDPVPGVQTIASGGDFPQLPVFDVFPQAQGFSQGEVSQPDMGCIAVPDPALDFCGDTMRLKPAKYS